MFIRNEQLFLKRPEAAALLAFACKEADRPHIHGVHFEPASGHAVATDGHRLAALSAADGEVSEGAPFTVPFLTMQTAVKACPTAGLISVKNGEITVHADEQVSLLADDSLATLPFVAPSTDFPPWLGIVPALYRGDVGTPSIAFGADLLASLALVGKATEDATCVMHVPPSALDPALYVMKEWRVVIMPRRHGEEAAGVDRVTVSSGARSVEFTPEAGKRLRDAVAGDAE